MALVVLSTEGCRPCAPHCGRERKSKFRERAPEGQKKDKRISTNAHICIYVFLPKQRTRFFLEEANSQINQPQFIQLLGGDSPPKVVKPH